ncbi:MAG: 50S ribosomal protein L10 [Acidimicrobiales bacterium]
MDNPRAEKVAVVTEVREHFQRSSAAILTEYRGLTVKDLAGLRRTLRDAGCEYKIYKNTLVRFAAADLGLDGLESLLVGPTAIAFVEGDASNVAKALRDYSRTNPKLTVKGGVLGTKLISVADAAALADLPPRDVVLARLAGALAAPMQTFAGLLQAVPRSFAYGLKALIEKRGGLAEAATSEGAAAAPGDTGAEAPSPAEPVAEAPAEPVEASAAPVAESPAPEEAAAEPEVPAAEVPVAPAESAQEAEAVEAVEKAIDEAAEADVEAAADAEESDASGDRPPGRGDEALSEQGEESAALDQVTGNGDEGEEDHEATAAAYESEDTSDDDDPAAPPYDDTEAPSDEEANIPAEVAAMSEIGDSEVNEPDLPIVAVDPEDDAPPVDGAGD